MTVISPEACVYTAWSPGPEYVDGDVVERNSGEPDDIAVQGVLTAILFELRKRLQLRVFPKPGEAAAVSCS